MQVTYINFSDGTKEEHAKNTYFNTKFHGAQNLECERGNLADYIGSPTRIDGLKMPNCSFRVLEDTKEIQAIISKDWDKLIQLQKQ